MSKNEDTVRRLSRILSRILIDHFDGELILDKKGMKKVKGGGLQIDGKTSKSQISVKYIPEDEIDKYEDEECEDCGEDHSSNDVQENLKVLASVLEKLKRAL